MSAWRTALRVARREARRAKGRSSLVLAMITLPVLCLAFAAVTYDMFTLTPREQVDRDMGTADAIVRWPYDRLAEQDPSANSMGSRGEQREQPATEAEFLAVLPPGSRVIPYRFGIVEMRTATGVGSLNARGLDITDPLTRGVVTLLSGRAPTGAGEVALTEKAVDRLGASIGDTVGLADDSRRWTVVGIIEFPADLLETVLFHPSGFPLPEKADEAWAGGWLADTPAPITWPDVKRLNQHGLVVISRAVVLDPPPPSESPWGAPPDDTVQALAVGVLIAGLGVLEVVLLAGPAFAVGARRRQRDLALVAANGGTPKHLRRIVLADGVVLGVVGGVIGIVVGTAVAFAGRPLVEEHLAQSRAGGYRVYPLALAAIAGVALLTGLLAALVPAFVAARQDVVAGLAGRRGLVRSRKRWLVAGLVMTGLGAVGSGYGAWRINTNVILAGLILGELGLVLCTPSLVGLVARIGRVLPLAPRIALRDTARNRAAAAPAISAVMAAVAGSVAIGVYLSSSQAQHEASYLPSQPTGYAMVIRNRGPEAAPISQPDRLAQAMRESLPVADVIRVEEPACPAGAPQGSYCGLDARLPEERRCPLWNLQSEPTAAQKKAAARDDRCRDEGYGHWMSGGGLYSMVDDGSAVAALTGASADDTAAAAATLRAGGVVVADERVVVDGRVTLTITRPDPKSDKPIEEKDLPTLTAPAYVLRTGVLARSIYSPQIIERAGLRTQLAGLVAATTRMPTQAEEDRLNAELPDIDKAAQLSVERGPQVRESPQLIVLAIAAGLITLGAAGIATGLAAADGRRDLSTLAAVGASPRVRRLLSLSQSGVIAGLGSLLGIAAGLGAAFAILRALNQGYADTWPAPLPYPLVVPWKSLAIVLVVPLVAMLGAGLLTRSRLPIERRLG